MLCPTKVMGGMLKPFLATSGMHSVVCFQGPGSQMHLMICHPSTWTAFWLRWEGLKALEGCSIPCDVTHFEDQQVSSDRSGHAVRMDGVGTKDTT